MANINSIGADLPGWVEAAVAELIAPRPGMSSPAVHDPRAIGARNAVIERLSAMNSRHLLAAYDRRGSSEALGPHAVAFLYQSPPQTSDAPARVWAATRLFLASDDVSDLAFLLARLADIASEHLAGRGVFDPLTVVNSRDEGLTPDAWYLGAAVSSLDTPRGPWARVRREVASPVEVPGRCYAVMMDGTRLVLDRAGQGAIQVRSTGQLDTTPGLGLRRWNWLRAAEQQQDREVWHQLARLHWSAIEGQRRALSR